MATLVGSLVSLIVLFATLGADTPTTAEVSSMISKESPYVQDRNLILHRLARIEEKVDKLLDRPQG